MESGRPAGSTSPDVQHRLDFHARATPMPGATSSIVGEKRSPKCLRRQYHGVCRCEEAWRRRWRGSKPKTLSGLYQNEQASRDAADLPLTPLIAGGWSRVRERLGDLVKREANPKAGLPHGGSGLEVVGPSPSPEASSTGKNSGPNGRQRPWAGGSDHTHLGACLVWRPDTGSAVSVWTPVETQNRLPTLSWGLGDGSQAASEPEATRAGFRGRRSGS